MSAAMAISLSKSKQFKLCNIAVIFLIAKAQLNTMSSDHVTRLGGFIQLVAIQPSLQGQRGR